jgi:hypothetical protein
MEATSQTRQKNRRKLFRTVFGVFSLSGIMFAFQACYGTMQDFGQDILITGKVTSAVTKEAVAAIKVQIEQSGQYANTANDGTFSIYCERFSEYHLLFTDTDGELHGQYITKDTLMQLPEQQQKLTVNIELR